MDDKLKTSRFFIGPVNIVLAIVAFIVGTVLVLVSILTVMQGIALFVFCLILILVLALYNCIKENTALQKEIKKIQQNRDGLLEAKERYLDENKELKDQVSNINQQNLLLNMKLETNKIIIFQLFSNDSSRTIPIEVKNMLTGLNNYELEEGADINGKQIL